MAPDSNTAQIHEIVSFRQKMSDESFLHKIQAFLELLSRSGHKSAREHYAFAFFRM